MSYRVLSFEKIDCIHDSLECYIPEPQKLKCGHFVCNFCFAVAQKNIWWCPVCKNDFDEFYNAIEDQPFKDFVENDLANEKIEFINNHLDFAQQDMEIYLESLNLQHLYDQYLETFTKMRTAQFKAFDDVVYCLNENNFSKAELIRLFDCTIMFFENPNEKKEPIGWWICKQNCASLKTCQQKLIKLMNVCQSEFPRSMERLMIKMNDVFFKNPFHEFMNMVSRMIIRGIHENVIGIINNYIFFDRWNQIFKELIVPNSFLMGNVIRGFSLLSKKVIIANKHIVLKTENEIDVYDENFQKISSKPHKFCNSFVDLWAENLTVCSCHGLTNIDTGKNLDIKNILDKKHFTQVVNNCIYIFICENKVLEIICLFDKTLEEMFRFKIDEQNYFLMFGFVEIFKTFF